VSFVVETVHVQREHHLVSRIRVHSSGPLYVRIPSLVLLVTPVGLALESGSVAWNEDGQDSSGAIVG